MRASTLAIALAVAAAGCDQLEGLTEQLEGLEEELGSAANPPTDALALAEQARQEAERAAQEAEARAAEAAGANAPTPSADPALADGEPTANPAALAEPAAQDVPEEAGAGGRPLPGTSEEAGQADERETENEGRPPGPQPDENRPGSRDVPGEPAEPTMADEASPPQPGRPGQRPSCSETADPPQCVIDRYRGRARHAYQIIALVDAYNAKGRFTDAVPHIQQLLQRYPTHARADRYRQLLQSRGIEPAR